MEHTSIDRYSSLGSWVHRIDPRVKIMSFTAFVFFVVLTEEWSNEIFLFYLLLISSVIVASKVPLSFVFKRSLVVLPFVLLVAASVPFIKGGNIIWSMSLGFFDFVVSDRGVETFVGVLAKSYLSALSMIVLSSTTRFPDLLEGYRKLKAPRIMVEIVSFTYRYVFLLADEVLRMKKARDARSAGGGGLWQIRTLGNMIGNLFVRSYERSERVYLAMASRGFDGRIRTVDDFHINALDALFLLFFVAAAAAVRFL